MKLRNKKTGEIIDADFNATISGRTNIIIIQNGPEQLEYNSLAALNAEWEDVSEEQKRFYWLDYNGDIYNTEIGTMDRSEIKEIGNYFESKEEAELAVRKLKAWKRLKDKGFRFTGYDSGHNANKELCGQAYFKAGNFWFDIKSDLELLFGGEE